MMKGKWDKKGQFDRGEEDYKSQIAGGNKDFVEPKNGGGEQGAPAKNHWEGDGGAKASKEDSSASREPHTGGM